jgi:hypothetical protein
MNLSFPPYVLHVSPISVSPIERTSISYSHYTPTIKQHGTRSLDVTALAAFSTDSQGYKRKWLSIGYLGNSYGSNRTGHRSCARAEPAQQRARHTVATNLNMPSAGTQTCTPATLTATSVFHRRTRLIPSTETVTEAKTRKTKIIFPLFPTLTILTVCGTQTVYLSTTHSI